MHKFYPTYQVLVTEKEIQTSGQCATFMKQRLYVKDTYQKQQEEFYLTLNRINVHIYHIM